MHRKIWYMRHTSFFSQLLIYSLYCLEWKCWSVAWWKQHHIPIEQRLCRFNQRSTLAWPPSSVMPWSGYTFPPWSRCPSKEPCRSTGPGIEDPDPHAQNTPMWSRGSKAGTCSPWQWLPRLVFTVFSFSSMIILMRLLIYRSEYNFTIHCTAVFWSGWQIPTTNFITEYLIAR